MLSGSSILQWIWVHKLSDCILILLYHQAVYKSTWENICWPSWNSNTGQFWRSVIRIFYFLRQVSTSKRLYWLFGPKIYFAPFKSKGISNSNQYDQSIFILMGLVLHFFVFIQILIVQTSIYMVTSPTAYHRSSKCMKTSKNTFYKNCARYY